MPFDFVPGPVAGQSRRRSRRAHHHGLCGEAAAAHAYSKRGATVVAERFRGGAGEVDLIVRDGGCLVFVEVKAAASFDQGMSRIGPDKVARLYEAAQLYLAQHSLGQDQDMRFDVALVDAMGRVEICENAIWFD